MMKKQFNFPVRHSFPRYLLNKKNIELYHKHKKILDVNSPPMPKLFPNYFNLKPMQISIETGTLEKKPDYVKTSYQRFQELGLSLNSRKKQPFKRKVEYYITKTDGGKTEDKIKYPPKFHWFEHDKINNSIRMYSTKKHKTDWFYIDGKPRGTTYTPSIREKYGLIKSNEKTTKNINIPRTEIPLGISYEEHKLVCIEKSNDCWRIGIVGRSGSGKTRLLHYFADMLYWWNQSKILVMYDYKGGESYEWNMPSKVHDWNIQLKEELNLEPRPLPCVMLTPYSDKIKDRKHVGADEGLHCFLSFSWKYFINNWNELTKNYPELGLVSAKMEIDWGIIGNSKTKKAVLDYLDNGELLPILQSGKSGLNMKNALLRRFNYLFNSQLFDITNNIPSKVTIKGHNGDEVEDTLIAFMKAGVVPVIMPKHLESLQFGKSSFLPAYMDAILKRIYDLKNDGRIFPNEQIYVLFDEVEKALSLGVSGPLVTIASLGRSEGIGLLWANQYYSQGIPDQVKENTDYLFVLSNPSNKKDIFNKYNHVGINESIHTIGEKNKFECYLLHDEPIITYDLDTGEREVNEYEPIRLSYFPPLSQHKKPGS